MNELFIVIIEKESQQEAFYYYKGKYWFIFFRKYILHQNIFHLLAIP